MNVKLLEKIKRLTIAALVSDDKLMGILVLKGGNALNIAYDISSRGSIDVDFSIKNDFTAREKKRLKNQFDFILNKEFSKEGLKVFDVIFSERPKKIDDVVKDFWGGYLLEFKLIESSRYDEFGADIQKIRRNALQVGRNDSTKFKVDISKYEYIGDSRSIDIEGSVVLVYSPEMIVLEKLRAICQQLPDYKNVITSKTSVPRARDFYDIHNICSHFHLDFEKEENVKLAKIIFSSKKVPLKYIEKIESEIYFHRENWDSVIQTVDPEEKLEDFEFYFNFVIDKFKHLRSIKNL